MHLVINGTEIGRQRGGNESFLLGLLQGIQDAAIPLHVTLLVTPAGAKVVKPFADTCQIIDIGAYHRLAFYLWQQTALLRRLKPDWYLSTYFLPPFLPCRGAVIVHDVSFCAHPSYFPPVIALYMRLLTGLAIRRAQVVALDSEFTAREVQQYYPQVAEKGIVTWMGVDRRFMSSDFAKDDHQVLDRYRLQGPYILAIGNIHPRKNLARLLEAYRQLSSSDAATPSMVWIGMPRWNSADLIREALEAQVILTGYVPPEDLPALYRGAAVFVYPSLYEGFGLPVLEAMASGTPVICSNTSSLPEVAGDAAYVVDPYDVNALAGALGRVLAEPQLADELRQRGYQRAQRFTYADTARTLYRALERKD
ncbi:MAG: glycosyltransferase family 4 protein [Anaerolineae bacterium]